MSHCDHDIWRTDLKIHRVDGRDTAYIPAKFHRNSFKNKRETRIEPVRKPYREVCLRSELWPWMAHQPNSWSKHPGTRIEQVLAYCRDEQKYVGCIELLFCLTVTMTFGVRTRKFIGLMDVILPIYQPSFTEIR